MTPTPSLYFSLISPPLSCFLGISEAPAVQSLSSPNTDNTSNNSESNGVKDSSDSIANAKSVE
ncbi:hypothetical protein H5410_033541 [Solanum commersonii]|uniref:Uncharacterized protein n=1 Tax=Solanum commersonii TaxID=4109 RepID=A0A9J5YN51_SOLCO|nr:hypothetical protein H5410_033541 [Solanum commersonii]